MVTGYGWEHGHPRVKKGLLGVRKPEIPTNSVMDGVLTVSLSAHSECLKAHRSLLPDAQRHQGLIWKEFAVNGSDLIVSVLEEFALGSGGGGGCWCCGLSSLLRVL